MERFTKEDCLRTEEVSLKNRVVVLKEGALPIGHPDQLFVCLVEGGVSGTFPIFASLSTGEIHHIPRRAVLGLLKPELLPEEAKLQLSQIRPGNARDLRSCEAEYSGYSFLADGRYTSGVWLTSPQEAMDYVEMQKDYQHRVLICDRDDFAVMEVMEGELIFPDREKLEAFRNSRKQDRGMQMT